MANYTAGQTVYSLETNTTESGVHVYNHAMTFVEYMNLDGTLMVRTDDGIYFPHEVYAEVVEL